MPKCTQKITPALSLKKKKYVISIASESPLKVNFSPSNTESVIRILQGELS